MTDGAQRVALAVLRGLAAAGCRVRVMEREGVRCPVSFQSRHAHATARCGSGAAAGILDAAAGADVVLPVSTGAAWSLATAARTPGDPAIVAPSPEAFDVANDKALLAEAAERLGVPVPAWRVIAGDDEIEDAAGAVGFPSVLRLRDDRGLFLPPAERYAVVRDVEQLRAAWRRLAAVRARPLLSAFVEGEGVGVGLVMDAEGRRRAAFCHRRLREYPPRGGPSALCESIHNPELVGLAGKLLAGLGFAGCALVEFRCPFGRAEPRLLEVNPRPWGSLPLALACGVNIPWVAAATAAGRDVRAPERYTPGVRMRFLHLDLAGAWALWKAGRRGASLRVLLDLFDPRIRPGIFDWRDPWPGLAYPFSGRAAAAAAPTRDGMASGRKP